MICSIRARLGGMLRFTNLLPNPAAPAGATTGGGPPARSRRPPPQCPERYTTRRGRKFVYYHRQRCRRALSDTHAKYRHADAPAEGAQVVVEPLTTSGRLATPFRPRHLREQGQTTRARARRCRGGAGRCPSRRRAARLARRRLGVISAIATYVARSCSREGWSRLIHRSRRYAPSPR